MRGHRQSGFETLEARCLLATVPVYHSLPGAAAALYLDFDGHFEPAWAGHNNVVTPAYDSDGDPAFYSPAELAFIENVWKVVAEDYAPFKIDVTTEQPPVLAAGVPIGQANGIALRVAIGGSSTDWYGGTWAGVAHPDSFTNAIANTAYAFSVFQSGVDTNPISLGRAASHEAGHAFGLEHQSAYDAAGVKVEEYLPPTAAWAAIMGGGTREHTTWHNGPSAAGAAVLQDDMALIGRAANGFGFRADDHGNTISTATQLTGGGPYWSASGLVGATTDVDMFKFTTTAPRELQIILDGPSSGQNLDAVLELYNAQGAFLASSNPSDSLDAVVQRNLTAGTYVIAVKSDGRYGRVGQYSLTVRPIVSVSVGDVAIAEGNTGERNAAFVVTLSDPMNETVTLSYSTADGTAMAGSDYFARSGTITISPGVLTQTVNVPLAGDTLVEADERFFFRLSGAVNVRLGDGEAMGTIVNDDVASAFAVSPEEQHFVYLVNRARHNPLAYQQERGLSVDLSTVAPRPPLAVSAGLFGSARFHAGEMATHNYFDHQSPVTGKWPNKLARDFGYPLPPQFLDGVNNIESIAAGGARDTAQEVVDHLIGDTGAASLGHRSLLLGFAGFENYREIGVGHSFNAASEFDHYWAIQSAYAAIADQFLTGVVFEDRNGNARYDLNEGLAGVRVTAVAEGGGTLSAETNFAGGWAIKAAAVGTYSITASGGQFSGAAEQSVVVTGASIEVDFISGDGRGIVDFDQPQVAAPNGLSAGVQAPNRVRLAWTDNSANEAAFRIERSTDGVNFLTVIDVPANVTSYDDAGLQSNITYSYRVRGLSGPVLSGTSNVAGATPRLIAINGTGGNDTYHVIRTGSLLQVYENTAPVGQPTYSSELAVMSRTLTINTLAGDDVVTVNTTAQSLGIDQLIYNAGSGTNGLVVESGSAGVESTAAGGTLDTTVRAGASLSAARLQQNSLTLAANSKLTLLPGGGTSVLATLNLATTAAVDITDNALVLDYTESSPAATVRARILSGRGGAGFGAAWNGSGITSSTVAAANATAPESRSVGYAENATLPLGAYTSFRGLAVDSTAVLIAYTRTGDANLDGVVNDDDVTIVGASYAPAAQQPEWELGDFEYNGRVDDDDVTLLGAFFVPGAGVAAATPLSGGEVRGEVQSTKYKVPATAGKLRTKYDPAAATAPPRETFGREDVRGRAFDELSRAETRAELSAQRGQETRAQYFAGGVLDNTPADDGGIVDLLALAIASESQGGDSLSHTPLAIGRPWRAAHFFWPL